MRGRPLKSLRFQIYFRIFSTCYAKRHKGCCSHPRRPPEYPTRLKTREISLTPKNRPKLILFFCQKSKTCPRGENQAFSFSIFIPDFDQGLHHRLHLDIWIAAFLTFSLFSSFVLCRVCNCIVIESHHIMAPTCNHHHTINLLNESHWLPCCPQHLCRVTATNLLKVEVLLLLLLGAHIRDLGMGGLVPKTKVVNRVSFEPWLRVDKGLCSISPADCTLGALALAVLFYQDLDAIHAIAMPALERKS